MMNHRDLKCCVRKTGMLLMLLGILSLSACAAEPVDEAGDNACRAGASSEAAALSCQLGQPVNDDGFTADELSAERGGDGALEASWDRCEVLSGPCTGPFGGCSEVRFGAWSFRACGPNLQAWVRICQTWPWPAGPVEWGVRACGR